jgi:4-hydroxy-3-polyprenylbenzoate decarboxylase
VLVVRETPLHRGHLAAMLAAADAGAVVMPPMPGFYGGPKTLDDLVNFTVGRVLDLLDIEHSLLRRWGDAPPAGEDG